MYVWNDYHYDLGERKLVDCKLSSIAAQLFGHLLEVRCSTLEHKNWSLSHQSIKSKH